MRRVVLTLLLFVLIVTVIMPFLIARGCTYTEPHFPEEMDDNGLMVSLYINDTAAVLELSLESYVAGVVAAEMPAKFHIEALKAGAIAARTYVVRRLRSAGGPGCDRHPLADVCDDPAHHQAWTSVDDLRRRWGFFAFPRLWAKVVRAVTATEGLILTYDGKPIDALYHSTCGGITASAEEVWGTDLPYLQSVSCHWDRHSPRFRTEFSFSQQEIAQRLSGERTITVVSMTLTGRVRTVKAGDNLVVANTIRSLFELPSTWFTISANGDVTFHVRGYGHGVGMCQYGADGMARDGAEFMDILTYYYSDVQIEWLDHVNSYGHRADHHQSD